MYDYNNILFYQIYHYKFIRSMKHNMNKTIENSFLSIILIISTYKNFLRSIKHLKFKRNSNLFTMNLEKYIIFYQGHRVKYRFGVQLTKNFKKKFIWVEIFLQMNQILGCNFVEQIYNLNKLFLFYSIICTLLILLCVKS